MDNEQTKCGHKIYTQKKGGERKVWFPFLEHTQKKSGGMRIGRQNTQVFRDTELKGLLNKGREGGEKRQRNTPLLSQVIFSVTNEKSRKS